jgi:hypothetical protein
MHLVYKTAVQVLAWIGEDVDNDFDIIKTLVTDKELALDILMSQSTAEELMEALCIRFTELVLRDYWRRLWVVQEIAHAKQVQVICGSYCLPYAGLVHFCEEMQSSARSVATLSHHLATLFYAARQFLNWRPGIELGLSSEGSLNINNLFRAINQKKCGDPRDKLFGIHSLLPTSLQQRIAIDYSLSAADIFASATQAIIENDNVIYIITYMSGGTAAAGETNDFLKTPAVPSWAANWAGDVLVPISEFVEGVKANNNVKPFFKFCHRSLEVRGVRLGVTNYVQVTDWQRGDLTEASSRVTSLVDQSRNLLNNFLKIRPVDKSTYALTSLCGLLRYLNNHEELSISSSSEKLLFCEPSGDIRLGGKEDREMGENPSWLRDRAMFLFVPIPSTVDEGRTNTNIPLSKCIGLGPASIQEGDIVTVLAGCKAPVILRPIGKNYEVVGDAYIDIFMDGEAMEGFSGDYDELESFVLC